MSKWSEFKKYLSTVHWLVRANGLRQQLTAMDEQLQTVNEKLEAFKELKELHRLERSRAWVCGHHMRVDPDDTVVSVRLRELGWFEPYETRLIQRLVSPGNVVVDVGANIGYYTLQFARLVGSEGHVFAFEPDPHNFELLQRNVWQNGYQNVTLVRAAITATAGKIQLFQNPDNQGDHRIYASDAGRTSVDVDAITMDEFFAADDRRLDLVKMDIQGAEGAAFKGMQTLLSNGRVARIVTEFWPRGLKTAGFDAQVFLQERLAQGFEIRVIDESTEQLLPLDIPALLKRLPVEQVTDWLFTNLLLEHTTAAAGKCARTDPDTDQSSRHAA